VTVTLEVGVRGPEGALQTRPALPSCEVALVQRRRGHALRANDAVPIMHLARGPLTAREHCAELGIDPTNVGVSSAEAPAVADVQPRVHA